MEHFREPKNSFYILTELFVLFAQLSLAKNFPVSIPRIYRQFLVCRGWPSLSGVSTLIYLKITDTYDLNRNSIKI